MRSARLLPPRPEGTMRSERPSGQDRPREAEIAFRTPLDWRRAVLDQRRGSGDPTVAVAGEVVWCAASTPEGTATLALRGAPRGTGVRAAAWGPGAGWMLDHAPALCGARDEVSGFDPGRHPLVRALHERHRSFRIGRSDRFLDALAGAVLEQKVTIAQAFGAWRRLVSRHGVHPPGPAPSALRAAPSAAVWAAVPSWEWHRAGVEPPQARTLVTSARECARTDTISPSDDRRREALLRTAPGVGPWTRAETLIRWRGDPDQVTPGDAHLPHRIGFALTGARVDDAGMEELLRPWPGHRQRVIRLLLAFGPVEPRRAPRLHPEDHRRR